MEDENENDTEMDNSSQIYSSSLDSSLRFSSKTSHRNSIFISSPTPSRKKFPTFKKKNYQSTIIVDQSEWNSMDPSKKIKLEKIFGVEVSPSKTSPKLQTVNVTDNNGNINTENSSLLNFSSSGPSHVIPHCFQASINSKFNNNLCHFCKEIVFIFGYQCLDCGYVIHQKCLSKVSESCKMTTDLMFWTYSEKSKWTYIDLPEDFNGVEIIQTHSEELAIILNGNNKKKIYIYISSLLEVFKFFTFFFLLYRKWRRFRINFAQIW